MIRPLRTLFANSKSGAVIATEGGVAVGRDIRDSTIHIGLDENEIGRRLDALTHQVAREKGVAIAPLRTVLAKLGEVDVGEHEITSRLEAAADQLVELRSRFAQMSSSRPEFEEVRQQVLGLLERGELDAARIVLQNARKNAQKARIAPEEAQFVANEGLIDHLQLDYCSAAAKYAEAANLVREFDPAGEWGLLMNQAGALTAYGWEFGNSDTLGDAIAIYRRCLALVPRQTRPLDWATTQDSLGIALSRLGEIKSSTDYLKEAVAAYCEALQELSISRAPFDLAGTKNNLGNALTALGDREKDVSLLEAALVVFKEALEVCTRERVPLEWANIQSNIGTTLQIIGKFESGTERLAQAVESYEAALSERTRDRVPLDWALTQNNLGNTLHAIGERERSIPRLQAAIRCFLEALKERTKERVPVYYAMTVSNVGGVLVLFGCLESNPHRIQAGIDAFQEALSIFERVGAERFVAGTKRNLAGAKAVLSDMISRNC